MILLFIMTVFTHSAAFISSVLHPDVGLSESKGHRLILDTIKYPFIIEEQNSGKVAILSTQNHGRFLYKDYLGILRFMKNREDKYRAEIKITMFDKNSYLIKKGNLCLISGERRNIYWGECGDGLLETLWQIEFKPGVDILDKRDLDNYIQKRINESRGKKIIVYDDESDHYNYHSHHHRHHHHHNESDNHYELF